MFRLFVVVAATFVVTLDAVVALVVAFLVVLVVDVVDVVVDTVVEAVVVVDFVDVVDAASLLVVDWDASVFWVEAAVVVLLDEVVLEDLPFEGALALMSWFTTCEENQR